MTETRLTVFDANAAHTLAVMVHWIESERGWGTRPDGTTLHKDMSTAENFIAAHWRCYQEQFGSRTPDEYTYPFEPQIVQVSAAHHAKVQTEESFWVDPNRNLYPHELR